MRRIPTLIGASLEAAATASAIAVSGGSAQAPGERTLTFVERTVPRADAFADVPPLSKKSVSKGDGYLFRNDVLDTSGAKLGIHEGRCSYLRVTPRFIGSRLLCDGVYTLKDGMFTGTTAFTFTKKPKVDFTVAGGTGAYEGARGSGTLTYRSLTNPLADTTIHLLP